VMSLLLGKPILSIGVGRASRYGHFAHMLMCSRSNKATSGFHIGWSSMDHSHGQRLTAHEKFSCLENEMELDSTMSE
jgi:hypothetical protein